MSKAWKAHELRVAKALGGSRSGPLGKNGSDVRDSFFSVECKYTTRYSLRRDWLEQARRQSRQEGKPFALVISEHGDRNPIVVLDFKKFVEIAQVAGLVAIQPIEVETE